MSGLEAAAGRTAATVTRTPTHLAFEEYDLPAQIAISHHYWMIDGQLKRFRPRTATSGRPNSTSWPGSPE